MPVKVNIPGHGKTLILEGPIRRFLELQKIELLKDVAKYHTNVTEILFSHVHFHELSDAFLEALEETLKSRIWKLIEFKYCTGIWTRRFLDGFAQHSKCIRFLGSTEDSNLFRSFCKATTNDAMCCMEDLQLQTLFQDFSVLLQNCLGHQSCHLERLTLRECSFLGENPLKTLVSGFRDNQSLKYICLQDCRFRTSEKARVLWEALDGHPNLEGFSLIHNQNDSLSITDGLGRLVRSCKRLTKLKICHPPNTTQRHLHQVPTQNQVQPPQLGNTRQGGWWLQSLEIHSMRRLEVLDLSGNQMHDETIQCLINAAPSLSRLKHLQLEGNLIGDSGMRSLASALLAQQWSNLKVLCMSNNSFGNQGAQFLLEAMKAHKNLEIIDLSNEYECRDEIMHFTRLNVAGRRLWNSPSQVPFGLWPLVLERIYVSNPTWTKEDKASVCYAMLRNGPFLFA